MSAYVPDRGDLVWLDFSPQAGHEQAGHRPGLVLSPAFYNGVAGLAIVCPITSKAKGYPFEVPLPRTSPVRGVVLADQATCVDWHSRNIRRVGAATSDVLREAQKNVGKLIGLR